MIAPFRVDIEVYPRVCGGTHATSAFAMSTTGLSPRVRGNLFLTEHLPVGAGSIPACAGEPVQGARRDVLGGVYPRVCGGTRNVSIPHTINRGLSPRVRGNLVHRPILCQRERSIPACAGEPSDDSIPFTTPRVYPRVCGGTPHGTRNTATDKGLSPRVRGNLRRYGVGSSGCRSIPACAGEPYQPLPRLADPTVYPRVCGGTFLLLTALWHITGLSPRVRGNQQLLSAAANGRGSIPACAGEPCPAAWYGGIGRVYPRVCGGTSFNQIVLIVDTGLSPRVRGNRSEAAFPPCPTGSIPACAGEPPKIWVQMPILEVYPRVCGGTRAAPPARPVSRGLSPRVRGNRQPSSPERGVPGSIPACAGEPPRMIAR